MRKSMINKNGIRLEQRLFMTLAAFSFVSSSMRTVKRVQETGDSLVYIANE